jgi:hypothetical protein
MDKNEPKKSDDQDVDESVDKRKRQLLKLALGSAVAYTVPLMASFPMEGLRIGRANAGVIGQHCTINSHTYFSPPGLRAANQTIPGRPFSHSQQPPGRPFNDSVPVGPAKPFTSVCSD